MTESEKNKIFSKSNCISSQLMFDYIDNKLSEKENNLVEKHLLGCELCSDAMEGLIKLKDRDLINKTNEKIRLKMLPELKKENKTIFFNYRVITGIAAGLILLISAIFLFNQFNNKVSENKSIAQFEVDEKVKSNENADKKPDDSSELIPMVKEEDKQSEKKITDTENINLNKQDKNKEDKKETNIPLAGVSHERYFNSKKSSKIEMHDEDLKSEKASQEIINNAVAQSAFDKKGEINDVPQFDAKDLEETGSGKGDYKTVTKETGNNLEQTETIEVLGKTKSTKLAEAQKNRTSVHNEGKTKGKEIDNEKKTTETLNTSAPQSVVAVTTTSAYGGISGNVDQTILLTDSISVSENSEPQFVGGADSLNKYIFQNYKYPTSLEWRSEMGTKIIVEFSVNENGEIKNSKIVKGISSAYNTEALRVVNNMPKWKSAKLNGKNISTTYHLPIQLEIK